MNEPTASRVQFDATVDDLVEVHWRFLQRSKVASSWPRADRLVLGLAVALVVFLLVRLPLDAPLGPSLMGAGAAAVIAYLTYPHDYERRVRRRMRRLLAEQFGRGQSLRCEVELRPEGIWVRQGDVEIMHDWAAVRTIADTTDGVEFSFSGGLLLVRNRAFATPAQRDQFLSQSRASVPPASGPTHS